MHQDFVTEHLLEEFCLGGQIQSKCNSTVMRTLSLGALHKCFLLICTLTFPNRTNWGTGHGFSHALLT